MLKAQGIIVHDMNEGLVKNFAKDMGFGVEKIGFVLQLGTFWSFGTVVCIVSVSLLGPPKLFAFAFLMAVWTVTCLNALVAGMARMMAKELETQLTSPTREAWAFLRRYLVSLVVGPMVFVLPILALLSSYAGGMHIVRAIAPHGPIISSILVIPTFFLLLLFILLGANLYLIPSVMGVRRCGALTAMKHLVGTIQQKPLELGHAYCAAVARAIPIASMTGGTMVLALVLATAVCMGVRPAGASFPHLTSPHGLLWVFSVGVIIVGWVAHLLLIMTSRVVAIYYYVPEEISSESHFDSASATGLV